LFILFCCWGLGFILPQEREYRGLPFRGQGDRVLGDGTVGAGERYEWLAADELKLPQIWPNMFIFTYSSRPYLSKKQISKRLFHPETFREAVFKPD